MPKEGPPKDLLDWLRITDAPEWNGSRLLGPFVSVIFLLLFLCALAAAFWLLLNVLMTPEGVGIGAGLLIVAVLSAPFLVWRTVIAHQTLGFTREGHITDRISKAVEQLGAEKTVKEPAKGKDGDPKTVERTVPNIEVRIGAILSLERIAQDSTRYDKGRDHVRVMEILCAYIRENAPARLAQDHPFGEWEPLKDDPTDEERKAHEVRRKERFGEFLAIGQVEVWSEKLPLPREDIAQALKVIGRRDADQRRAEARWGRDAAADAEWEFDKPAPHLPDDEGRAEEELLADFEIQLRAWKALIETYRGYRPDLRHTNLQGTDLSQHILSGAQLRGARLEGASLHDARLKGADLGGARLEGAILYRARLEGADLTGARLEGVLLSNTDLTSVPLSQEQVDSCFGDASVTLPFRLNRSTHWPTWDLDHQAPYEWEKWRNDPANYVPPPPGTD